MDKNKTEGSNKSEKTKFTPFPTDTTTNPFLSKNI